LTCPDRAKRANLLVKSAEITAEISFCFTETVKGEFNGALWEAMEPCIEAQLIVSRSQTGV